MTTITQDQARKRFQSLTPSLQDAVFSVQTAEIISGVADQNNLDDEKSSALAYTISLALLGFIHPEDVPKELQERAGIAQQAASSISSVLNNKILNKLRADLEKTYAPALREHEHNVETPTPPKTLEEIKKPAGAPPKPIDVRKVFDPTKLTASSPIKPPLPKVNASPFTKTPFHDTSSTNDSVGKVKEPMSEFAKLRMKKGGGAPDVGKPITSNEPQPLILHKENETKLSQFASKFKLDIPLSNLSKAKTRKGTFGSKPAILEFGGNTQVAQDKENSTELPRGMPAATSRTGPRIVHYTESRSTALGHDGKPMPKDKTMTPSAGREIKEITSELSSKEKVGPPPILPRIPRAEEREKVFSYPQAKTIPIATPTKPEQKNRVPIAPPPTPSVPLPKTSMEPPSPPPPISPNKVVEGEFSARRRIVPPPIRTSHDGASEGIKKPEPPLAQ